MGGEHSDAEVINEDIVLRRKRALYRAQYRGTKEMDWMLGRYAEANLPLMSPDDLTTFERFLQEPDPEINKWLLDPGLCSDAEFAELLLAIRSFNSII